MESQVFDVVKFEKEKAIARFNCFRKIVKLWQIFELLVVLGLISWSSARVPEALKVAARCSVEFSTYLFNHHVVFLIGNAIIVLLFVLCRQNDVVNVSGTGGDLYDDYVKHSEAVHHQTEPTLPPPSPTPYSPPAEEKQIVVCTEDAEAEAIPQCDDVAAAIEKATRQIKKSTRQIKKFQRTQSEKLKRAITVRPQPELRRSETQNRLEIQSSRERFDAVEIERLSSDEFQRTVDAFIDKHWSRNKTTQNQFEEYEKSQLLKMA